MAASRSELRPAKLALRRQVSAQRRVRPVAEREQAAAALAAAALTLPRLRTAGCVALYASLPDEPGTGPLRTALRELAIRVLLPVVGEPGSRRLDWAQDAGALATTGELNLPEPSGPRFGPDELAVAQVVLVPALAVDTNGTRLGRGRGYYDAALSHAGPDALILALIHDQELLDAALRPIPREPHDLAVHGVLTPTGVSLFSPGRG